MGTENTITLILQARDEASAAMSRALDALGASSAGFRGHAEGASASTTTLGLRLREATLVIRGTGAVLLAELNPALAAGVMQLSRAGLVARESGVALGALAVGVATAAIAATAYIRGLKQWAIDQAAVNLAVAQFDTGALRGKLQEAAKDMERFGEQSKSLLGMVLAGWEILWDRLTGQKLPWEKQAEYAKALEQVLPVERAQRMAEAVMRVQQARQGELEVLVQVAALEADEYRLKEVHVELARAIQAEADAEERRLRAKAKQEQATAEARREPAAALQIITDQLDKDLEVLATRTQTRFGALGERLRAMLQEIRERKLPAPTEWISIKGATLAEMRAGELAGDKSVLQIRRERLDMAVQELTLARERYGLSQSEQVALELQLIDAREALKIQEAEGNVRKENLAQLEATIARSSVLRQELERTDFAAGLQRGLRDTQEDLESWGRAGQQTMRDFAGNVERSFSDLLFLPMERGWKKTLEEVPLQLAKSTMRQLTDLLARIFANRLFAGAGGSWAFLPGGGASVPAAAALAAGGGVGGMAPSAAGLSAAGAAPGALSAPPSWFQTLLPGAGPFLSAPLALLPWGSSAVTVGGMILPAEAVSAAIEAGVPMQTGTALTLSGALAGTAGALGLGFTIWNALQGAPTWQNIATSAVSGALSGALFGSAFGPPGTLVGAIAGGALGAGAGFLGKGGAKKKPTTAQATTAAASAGAQALSAAIEAAATIEELVAVLNKSWSPYNEVVIVSYDRPAKWYGQAGTADYPAGTQIIAHPREGRLYTAVGILSDSRYLDNLDVQVGPGGSAVHNEQLTQQAQTKGRQLLDQAATALFAYEEELPGAATALGGHVTRRTYLPASRFQEAQGQQLLVSPDALKLAGFDDNWIEAFLRRLRDVDRNRSLGILPASEFA